MYSDQENHFVDLVSVLVLILPALTKGVFRENIRQPYIDRRTSRGRVSMRFVLFFISLGIK